jgi:hypothetical protein
MIDKIVKNDHKSVLVPIEAWEYNSPYLKYIGKKADIGLFAEAFIYYDRVYVNLLTPQEFEEIASSSSGRYGRWSR